MNHSNVLVFVSSGENVTIFKVAEKPTTDIYIFDSSKATVLTAEQKTVPAAKYPEFEAIRPYLQKAV